MGMLSHPIDTLYKEFVQPLEMAGKCLGKAVYLACTDPARLARAGIRNVEQLTTRAHQDPEGLIAASVGLFVSPTASAAKIINFKGVVNAIKENHRVATFVQKTKKAIEHGKQAVLKPLAVVGEQAKETILHSTNQWKKFNSYELKKIGEKSLQSDIRKLKGSADDAFSFFKKQVDVFDKKSNETLVGIDKNGIIFSYRPSSKSGPPTIDIKGVAGLRKIKFLE